jgi:adenylate cyclase
MRLLRVPRFPIAPAALTVAVILVVLLLFVSGTYILDVIELKTYDMRLRARGPRSPSSAVVIAAIDEKSLDAEGRWPWPRSKIAALIDALARDGARVIAFDIAFSEPDENSQLALLEQLARQMDALDIRDRRLARFLSETRRDADNDLAMATAIARSSAAVVLGYFFHVSEATLEYRLDQAEIEQRLERLDRSKYPSVKYKGSDLTAPFITAYAPETNLDAFSRVAAGSGFFSLRSDPDGLLRRLPLMIRAGEDVFPPLAVVAAWQYSGRPPLTVHVDRHGVEGLQMGADRFIPTDPVGQVLINYLGPPKTFPQVSVTDILRGETAPGTFRDRIVLVGATALTTYDLRNTPFSPIYPGTEVHASVIDNILTGSFVGRSEWARIFDVLTIVGLGALAGIILPFLSPLEGLAFAAGLFVLYVFGCRWLFEQAQVWLNMVYPLLALSSTYTVLTAYAYLTEQRQRKRVKDTFRQYVAPEVVEEMLKDPARLRLGGEEKILTVLFSDLEGFTTHSERHAPHEMAEMLSEYYNRITEQVFVHRGTLKEYVGDELMAIFGAPLEQQDHAVRACAAALAMRDQRRALAVEWARIGRPALRARTGVNSGSMLVGNLGSKYRFAYGVLGDQVNVASRLEGLNRTYGTEILVGENTARLVANAFRLRELDTVRVLGRTERMRVYELLEKAGPLPPEIEQALRAYTAGLEAYRQRAWEDARALFLEASALWPADGASRAMAERCDGLRKAPPDDTWDGAFEQIFKK